MRDTRAISQAFERYHRERAVFAGSLADLARHEGNCSPIEEAGGVPLLATMLEDPVPGIRCTAAAALGRLATQSETVSNKIIADGTLHVLVKLLAAPLSEDAAKRREVLAQRKAAAFALRGTAKHGMGASRAVVEAGGLEAASASLRNSDAEAKEGIAWLFDCISSYSEDMAQAVVDADALPALVSCLDFSEVALKRAASAALGSIAQHSTACSMAVSQAGALPPLVAMLNQGENGDVRLLRNLLCALSQIVQGGPQQASEIVAAGALPAITRCLGAEDELVRRFAASALRDVMCHGQELARTTVNTPRCLQLLIESTRQAKGLNALPGVMALGHSCAWSQDLAEAVIIADGLNVLTVCLAHNKEEPVKCAAAWALGQAGKHCATHAQAVAESGALLALTGLEVSGEGWADLALKCCKAACTIISQLASLPALDALLRMPISVQVKGAVLERLTHVLATDPTNCKAAFVQTGGLQLVQELAEEPDSPFVAAVGKITALYPQELVNRFSPAYNRALMEQLSAPPGQVAPQMVVSDAVMAPAPTPASAAGPSAPPVPALSPRPAAYVAISSNSPPVPAPAAVPCHVPNCVPAPERSAHQPAQVSPQRASPPAPGPVALPSTTEPSPSPGAHLLELDVHDDVISAGEEKMEVSVVLAAEEAELSCGTDADVDSMADLN